MPTKPLSVRHLVLTILERFEKSGQKRLHVENLLDAGYQASRISAEDRRLGTYLTYGVLRHWFGLTHLIESLSHLPLVKMDSRTKTLLRMGLFQLSFMDNIPDYAAVSSTLDLAGEVGLGKKARGFINALLQKHIRQGKAFPTDLEYQFPSWLLHRLQQQYSPPEMAEIVAAYQQIPRLTLRINTLVISVTEYHLALRDANIDFTSSETLPEALILNQAMGDPRTLPGYEAGWFMIQDESSAQVAPFLNPAPGESVLDIGAAPGGKTTHLAALMKNQGRIVAVDVSQKRLEKLLENTGRLKALIVETRVQSAESLDQELGDFDKILIDAPCTGTGTLGKHPEILMALRENQFTAFAKTQLALLHEAFGRLKPEGTLVYSTCSIDADENQQVIQTFLQQQNQATLMTERQILPSSTHDGFYMAKVKKSV